MSEQETQRPGMGEQEPLLGRPGDASLEEGLPLYNNLIIGTILLHTGCVKAATLTRTSQALERSHKQDPGSF
jgi:hypothetical protein